MVDGCQRDRKSCFSKLFFCSFILFVLLLRGKLATSVELDNKRNKYQVISITFTCDLNLFFHVDFNLTQRWLLSQLSHLYSDFFVCTRENAYNSIVLRVSASVYLLFVFLESNNDSVQPFWLIMSSHVGVPSSSYRIYRSIHLGEPPCSSLLLFFCPSKSSHCERDRMAPPHFRWIHMRATSSSKRNTHF